MCVRSVFFFSLYAVLLSYASARGRGWPKMRVKKEEEEEVLIQAVISTFYKLGCVLEKMCDSVDNSARYGI